MLLGPIKAKVSNYFFTDQKTYFLGLWALVILLWLLFYPYTGIMHDAQLYTLQALSHLQPQLYENDIFLRFGSQDRFTIFSPLFAATINWVGLNNAGSLLTLAGHGAFFFSVFYLARKIMPYGAAVFTLGLIIVVNSYYGAEHVFHYIETFVTPRMLSEAFVLLAVAAWLNQKYLRAWLLLMVALILHPLMAMAGVVLLLSGVYLTCWRSLTVLAVAFSALLFLASLSTQWLSPLQLDPAWLGIVEERSSYLFYRYWSVDDFANALVPVFSLIIFGHFLRNELEKRIVYGAVFLAVMALAVQGIGGDLLGVKLVVQGQAWRWFWLVTLLAVLCLPLLLVRLWRERRAGRVIALTIIAAWLMRSQLMGLVVAIWALGLTYAWRVRWGSPLFWVAAKWFAVGLVSLPLLLLILVRHFHMEVIVSLFNGGRLQDFQGIWLEVALPLYLIFLIGLAYLASHRYFHIPAVVGLICLCTTVYWGNGKSWTSNQGGREAVARFAEFRSLIPPGANVLSMSAPVTTWVDIQRPHYISGIQSAGVVFSRDMAVEAQRREDAVKLICPEKGKWHDCWKIWLAGQRDFSSFCRVSGVEYIVSRAPIVANGLVEMNLNALSGLPFLYRCETDS